MTKLCLVRHGQTDWNIEGRWQGSNDQLLNAAGFAQAQQVALELAGQPFEAIYSSDLSRAYTTALEIARFHQLPVQTDAGLREINMGDWEGVLGIDIPSRFPLDWAERRRSPLESRPGHGESLVDLARRVVPTINRICERHPHGPLLIVSHGLALSVFIGHAHAYPLEQAYEHIPPNAHPVWLEWSAEQSPVFDI